MVDVIDLGLSPYGDVWRLQLELVGKRKKDLINDTLILVEHPHVITLGKHGNNENIKVSKEVLKEKGVDFYVVDRGGDITYHGPGQLVGYLIFKIQGHIGGIRKFIYFIEDSIIELLRRYNISASRNDSEIGVWVGNDKIAALGLALSDSVTYHGFALNVNTDLRYFDLIVPCGLKDRGTVSMKEILNSEIDLEKIRDELAEILISNWEANSLRVS